MGSHTSDIIPYTQPSHPTVEEYDAVLAILNRRFPTEIALDIVASSHVPCLAIRQAESPYLMKDLPSTQPHGFYITSDPLPVPEGRSIVPRRIVFQIKVQRLVAHLTALSGKGFRLQASIICPYHSYYKGCSGGTTFNILHSDCIDLSVRPLRFDSEMRKEIRKYGWDFVEGVDRRVAWDVPINDLPSGGECRNYKVEWTRGSRTDKTDQRVAGSGEEFLELLRPGCRVGLRPYSEYACGWEEVSIDDTTIEIEYEPW